MREGSLEAPVRHPIDWQNPDFTDPQQLDAETRRQFEICHGCRRCFNLCDAFPRLFDLVDAAGDAELAGVDSSAFKGVVDACTLCDMCFMTKCPYVPPHPFALDIPHLMLRHRATELEQGKVSFATRQLTETDRNGRLATLAPAVVNWASRRGNRLTRPILAAVAGVHPDAALPPYSRAPLTSPVAINCDAPAFGRQAVLFATCFAHYNTPSIGRAALAVLAHNGVAAQVVYPECCGMPQLEHGDLARVAGKAKRTAAALAPFLDAGCDVVALVPSCALMLKAEWPLIVPDDPAVRRLAAVTMDISDYVVGIARREGLAPGLHPVAGGVAIQLSCHARAQNVGAKGAELLRLIPETKVVVVERCSGHGGAWGVRTETFPVALKMGAPTARQVARSGCGHLAAECPLAGAHVMQGLERLPEAEQAAAPSSARHPIEILAAAYGLPV